MKSILKKASSDLITIEDVINEWIKLMQNSTNEYDKFLKLLDKLITRIDLTMDSTRLCYDSIFTFTFLPIQTMNIYFLFTSFKWTMLLHCSLFWSNNRTMHLHCSLLLIVQQLDRTMVYHCSLILNFHCLYKYINSSSLQLVLQLVFNKDLYQLNKLKTIPLATKALFSLERTWSQNDWLRSRLQIAWIFWSRNRLTVIKRTICFTEHNKILLIPPRETPPETIWLIHFLTPSTEKCLLPEPLTLTQLHSPPTNYSDSLPLWQTSDMSTYYLLAIDTPGMTIWLLFSSNKWSFDKKKQNNDDSKIQMNSTMAN